MSNLLQKASIVTTPTAYGVGVLNSIKPAQSFGEELITNGNFASGYTGWSTYGVTSVSDGIATIGASANSGIFQTILTQSRKYKITLNVTSYNGVGTVEVCDNNGDIKYSVTSIGVQSFTFTQTHSTGQILFRGRSNAIFSLSSVSVKEVTDADFQFSRNSSATRVNPDYLIQDVSILSSNLVQNGNFSELGSELITNGNFDTDTNWTKGTGTTISGGNANFVNASGVSLYQNIGTQTGTVKVEFTVTNYTSGTLNVYSGGNQSVGVVNVSANALGTYTAYLVRTGGNVNIIFGSSDSFTGSIDFVSVKQVDPNDNWTLGTGWSFGTNEAIVTNSTVSSIYQEILTINKLYKVSFTISSITSGSLKIGIGTSFSQEFTSAGTYTFTGRPTTSNLLQRITPSTGTNASITNVSAIEVQQTDIPRLDYTNGTASILLEPQSTNLIPYSSDFSQWSLGSGTTVESGYLSPDGTNNAYKVSGGGGALTVGFPIADQTQTRTIYAKTVSGTGQAHLCSYFGNTNNLFTITNQWQRFEVNGTTTPTGSVNFYGVDFRGSTNLSEIIIWGAQTEVLTYATSYIPTSGSAITRAAETLNNAVNSDLINSTEGVLYFEGSALADDGTNRFISLTDGSNDNRILFGYRAVSNQIFARIEGNNSASVDLTTVLSNTEINAKIAISYDSSYNYKMFVNGFLVDSGVGTDSIVGLDRLDFTNASGTENFYGNTKDIRVYNEALTDAQLQTLTTL